MRGFALIRLFLSAFVEGDGGVVTAEVAPAIEETATPTTAVVEAPKPKRNRKPKAKKVAVKATTKKVTKKRVSKPKKAKRGRPPVFSTEDKKNIGKLIKTLAADGEGNALGRASEILHATRGKKADLRVAAGFPKAISISMPWIRKFNGLYGKALPLGRPKLAA